MSRPREARPQEESRDDEGPAADARQTVGDEQAHDKNASAPRGSNDEMKKAADGTKEDGATESQNAKGQSSQKKSAPRSKRKRKTIIIVVVALLLAIAAGLVYYFYSAGYITTDDAFIDGHVVFVAPQEAGVITSVSANDNAHVKAGDPLVTIDPAEAKATLALRQAQLDQAKAQVVQAKAQIEQAKAKVEQTQSTLSGAKVNAKNARTQANRYQDLAKQSGSSAISKQTLDNAQTAADQAESQLDADRTEVDSAKAGVDAAQSTLQAAQAEVEAQQAAVQQAKVTLDRLTIAAPIAGQIVQKSVNLGSYVSPGTQMMAIVPEHLYVTANYKETQLEGIKIGAPVDIEIDAYPDVPFKGKVVSIQHGAGQAFQLLPPQNATGNFVKVVQRVPVRISIDSPSLDKYPIGPGMSVVPSIHTAD